LIATARFLCVAVGVGALLYLVAAAVGLEAGRDKIVFGFVGVVCAIVVESVLKRRQDRAQKPQKDEDE
jgi:uncharacterized membrane protein YhiD involved in acid resistance